MKTIKQAPSSNWKKLLPTIKATSSSTKKTTGKRKASTTTTTTVVKKSKTDTTTKQDVAIPKKDELWFGEDIDEETLNKAYGKKTSASDAKEEERVRKQAILEKMDLAKGKDAKLGKYVAIDCEMVGVGPGGVESALARVSLVNFNGAVLLDTYVKPQEKVTDYRTFVSGIKPEHLVDAMSFQDAQKAVADIIKDRILIGHAVYNDLQALMLDHPRLFIRDTSRYKPFRKFVGGRTPGLKMLVQRILNITIQSGSHSSVEDARFTMSLYKSVKDDWEKALGARHGLHMKNLTMKKQKTKKSKSVTIQEPVSSSEDEDEDEE
ncbi:ribonuclease H-like domain-containing protein [Radiomyces spectabilis]|uniref:ribonuclease H-like domain-containing protein n=1 Tax=Radiomyces spectabilis TaxID=64574 RepID=UPI00221E6508|nr:ribonuclease H-like domain-containing protein [Radiomyces spectabilis]KAI8366668.1 ribonuclease H-like domain-containing protein [Radiomyces spectabilis]